MKVKPIRCKEKTSKKCEPDEPIVKLGFKMTICKTCYEVISYDKVT